MFNKNWLRKYIKYTIIRAKHLQIKKTQTLWNRSKHTSNKQTLKTVQLWQCLVGTMIGVYIASNSIPLLQIEYRFHWENGPEKRPSKDRISIPMKKWWWAPFAWIVHVVPQKKLVLFCLTKMKMMTLWWRLLKRCCQCNFSEIFTSLVGNNMLEKLHHKYLTGFSNRICNN